MWVALRKESVDRNRQRNQWKPIQAVALRKESVDRNEPSKTRKLTNMMSLSARRAWIEMQSRWQSDGQFPVALRKESVDRNAHDAQAMEGGIINVALRKESVDRNRQRN